MNNLDEFLKELDGRGFNFMDKTFDEFGFQDEILNMVYEMYQAGLEFEKEEISNLKNEEVKYKEKHGKLIGKIHALGKKLEKLEQLEIENQTMEHNNVWLNKQYAELEKKLSRYKNTDYLLVPRNPTEKMIDAGEWELLDLNENVDLIYKAMIKEVEKEND